MKAKITMKDTTNHKFKAMVGASVSHNSFAISTVISFGNFHTSNLKTLEYNYNKKSVDIIATTLNSVYKFRIEESD